MSWVWQCFKSEEEELIKLPYLFQQVYNSLTANLNKFLSSLCVSVLHVLIKPFFLAVSFRAKNLYQGLFPGCAFQCSMCLSGLFPCVFQCNMCLSRLFPLCVFQCNMCLSSLFPLCVFQCNMCLSSLFPLCVFQCNMCLSSLFPLCVFQCNMCLSSRKWKDWRTKWPDHPHQSLSTSHSFHAHSFCLGW